MFSNETPALRRSPILGAMKVAAPALAMALSLAGASASHATAIYLGSDSYSTANTALLTGPVNINVYLTPQVYTANFGTAPGAPTFDLLVFCVDIYHWSGSNLAYDDEDALATNSRDGFNADLLSSNQIDQIAYLTNYGERLYRTAPATSVNKLAAIQGAIWQVANGPGLTITASNSAVDALIDDLAGIGFLGIIHDDVGGSSKNFRFIKETANYGTPGSHQAFVISTVPEPATWALMIGGFGLAGAMLRRRALAGARF